MPPPISPSIAKDLANVIEMIKKNGATIATNQKNYKIWFDGLKKANVDGTSEQIEMNQPRLAKVVELMDKDIYGVNAALSLLRQLAKDDPLMEAKGAVVKALTDKMSDTQKMLAKQLAEARAEDAKADKADQAAKKGAQAAESELDELKTQGDELDKLKVAGLRDLPKMVEAAKAADAKLDKTALTKARMRIIEIGGMDTFAGNLKGKLDRYKKNFPDLDRALKADLDQLFDTVTDALDLAADAMKKLQPLLELHALAKPKPANAVHTTLAMSEIKKMAVVIHMQPQDAPKLLKMMQDHPFDEWTVQLGKLASTLKLKDEHGKEMNPKVMMDLLFKKVASFKTEFDKKKKESLIDL